MGVDSPVVVVVELDVPIVPPTVVDVCGGDDCGTAPVVPTTDVPVAPPYCCHPPPPPPTAP